MKRLHIRTGWFDPISSAELELALVVPKVSVRKLQMIPWLTLVVS
jgi:hypothetical protein